MGRHGVPRNQNSAARFAVKTGDGAKDEGDVAVSKGKRVCKGVFKMSVRGMGGHVGRLPCDSEGFILMQDRERKVARKDGFVASFIVDGKRKKIALVQHGAHRNACAVQKNSVLLCL